jgi:hypothetical protein
LDSGPADLNRRLLQVRLAITSPLELFIRLIVLAQKTKRSEVPNVVSELFHSTDEETPLFAIAFPVEGITDALLSERIDK